VDQGLMWNEQLMFDAHFVKYYAKIKQFIKINTFKTNKWYIPEQVAPALISTRSAIAVISSM